MSEKHYQDKDYVILGYSDFVKKLIVRTKGGRRSHQRFSDVRGLSSKMQVAKPHCEKVHVKSIRKKVKCQLIIII